MCRINEARYIYEQAYYTESINFAKLANTILSRVIDTDGNTNKEISKWYSEAYHTLSLAIVMSNTGDGMAEAKMCISILFDRIKKYNLQSDATSLAMLYNQVAVCHIQRGEIDEAIKSWLQSYESFRNLEEPPQFAGTWPAVNVALVYVLEGRIEEAEAMITPMLHEHEDALGKEDLTTVELVFLG
jgi:tetratricopeptide (TPR) repeat protein